MPADRTGAGDPDRTLALLWRHCDVDRPAPRRRGPRPSRSVDDVVEAALAVADERGLEAVTVRAVAEQVGVAPMSLYTYVPGRAELLDLMVDTVYLRMDRPRRRSRSWRRRVTAVAEANRAVFEQHPWVAEVAASSRPPLGPGAMAKYEYELAAFDGTGLGDVETDAGLAFVLGFVQNHARTAEATRRAQVESGMDDTAWWEANAPLLARVLDPAAYPRAVRIGSAAGAAQGSAHNPEHAWAFGLARVLGGLATLVDERGAGRAEPRSGG
jgi:AcrR family transcriptional regulator